MLNEEQRGLKFIIRKIMTKFLLSLFFCALFVFPAFADFDTKIMAESFTATTLDGKPVVFDQMRGKVVVMTFWSTRCPICESEIPKLNKVAEKYAGNNNVVMLGLTMENEAMVSQHLRKKPFSFTIVPNSLGVIMKYADRSPNGGYNIAYPTMFIINKAGEVEFKGSAKGKSKMLDDTITRLLAS